MHAMVLVMVMALEPEVLREAAARSVGLIQRVNAKWKTPCVSCHHQVMGALALESARRHGVAVDEKLAQTTASRDYRLLLNFDWAVKGEPLIDPALSTGSMLVGAEAAGMERSLVTAAYARQVARSQMEDGSWMAFDNRPPHSHSKITATVLGMKAVEAYHPQPQDTVRRAKEWLKRAEVVDTEDATFRLLGLGTKEAAVELERMQRGDGGWGQTPESRQSDAYSTGQALYALAATGVWKRDGEQFEKGVEWLLRKQGRDGSWEVQTRLLTPAPVSPPYFESGFPHGKNQFLSMAATAWAVRALCEALPENREAAKPLPLPKFQDASLPWAQTALFGTAEEVSRLDVKAATPGGTTVLMVAADEAAKVKALLSKGANALAVTSTGEDALMMAAVYRGNAGTLDLLLKAGLTPRVKRKVRYDMNALNNAVFVNDLAMVQLLLERGAGPDQTFRVLGGAPMRPLLAAATFGNVGIVRALVKAGAKLEDVDASGMTALAWAALSGREEAVKTLVGLGANREHRDKFGLRPVDHAKAYPEAPMGAWRALQ